MCFTYLSDFLIYYFITESIAQESDLHGTLATLHPVIYKQFPRDPPRQTYFTAPASQNDRKICENLRKEERTEGKGGRREGCGTNGTS